MSRAVVIVGHPRSDTFCEALAEAYVRGARKAGHQADLVALSRLKFDPILTGAYVEVQPREPDLEAAYRSIMGADQLVIVFPLWLGDMPALLKGFLERVLQPDIIGPAKEGRFVKLLAGKSARIVVTMGMPAVIYRWWFGAHAVRILHRNVLGFLGARPVRSTILGLVEGVSQSHRSVWIARMERYGERLI